MSTSLIIFDTDCNGDECGKEIDVQHVETLTGAEYTLEGLERKRLRLTPLQRLAVSEQHGVFFVAHGNLRIAMFRHAFADVFEHSLNGISLHRNSANPLLDIQLPANKDDIITSIKCSAVCGSETLFATTDRGFVYIFAVEEDGLGPPLACNTAMYVHGEPSAWSVAVHPRLPLAVVGSNDMALTVIDMCKGPSRKQFFPEDFLETKRPTPASLTKRLIEPILIREKPLHSWFISRSCEIGRRELDTDDDLLNTLSQSDCNDGNNCTVPSDGALENAVTFFRELAKTCQGKKDIFAINSRTAACSSMHPQKRPENLTSLFAYENLCYINDFRQQSSPWRCRKRIPEFFGFLRDNESGWLLCNPCLGSFPASALQFGPLNTTKRTAAENSRRKNYVTFSTSPNAPALDDQHQLFNVAIEDERQRNLESFTETDNRGSDVEFTALEPLDQFIPFDQSYGSDVGATNAPAEPIRSVPIPSPRSPSEDLEPGTGLPTTRNEEEAMENLFAIQQVLLAREGFIAPTDASLAALRNFFGNDGVEMVAAVEGGLAPSAFPRREFSPGENVTFADIAVAFEIPVIRRDDRIPDNDSYMNSYNETTYTGIGTAIENTFSPPRLSHTVNSPGNICQSLPQPEQLKLPPLKQRLHSPYAGCTYMLREVPDDNTNDASSECSCENDLPQKKFLHPANWRRALLIENQPEIERFFSGRHLALYHRHMGLVKGDNATAYCKENRNGPKIMGELVLGSKHRVSERLPSHLDQVLSRVVPVAEGPTRDPRSKGFLELAAVAYGKRHTAYLKLNYCTADCRRIHHPLLRRRIIKRNRGRIYSTNGLTRNYGTRCDSSDSESDSSEGPAWCIRGQLQALKNEIFTKSSLRFQCTLGPETAESLSVAFHSRTELDSEMSILAMTAPPRNPRIVCARDSWKTAFDMYEEGKGLTLTKLLVANYRCLQRVKLPWLRPAVMQKRSDNSTEMEFEGSDTFGGPRVVHPTPTSAQRDPRSNNFSTIVPPNSGNFFDSKDNIRLGSNNSNSSNGSTKNDWRDNNRDTAFGCSDIDAHCEPYFESGCSIRRSSCGSSEISSDNVSCHGVSYAKDSAKKVKRRLRTFCTLKACDRLRLRRIPGAHAHNIPGLAFSPEGHFLASASIDGTVSIWKASEFISSDRAKSCLPVARLPIGARAWSVLWLPRSGIIFTRDMFIPKRTRHYAGLGLDGDDSYTAVACENQSRGVRQPSDQFNSVDDSIAGSYTPRPHGHNDTRFTSQHKPLTEETALFRTSEPRRCIARDNVKTLLRTALLALMPSELLQNYFYCVRQCLMWQEHPERLTPLKRRHFIDGLFIDVSTMFSQADALLIRHLAKNDGIFVLSRYNFDATDNFTENKYFDNACFNQCSVEGGASPSQCKSYSEESFPFLTSFSNVICSQLKRRLIGCINAVLMDDAFLGAAAPFRYAAEGSTVHERVVGGTCADNRILFALREILTSADHRLRACQRWRKRISPSRVCAIRIQCESCTEHLLHSKAEVPCGSYMTTVQPCESIATSQAVPNEEESLQRSCDCGSILWELSPMATKDEKSFFKINEHSHSKWQSHEMIEVGGLFKPMNAYEQSADGPLIYSPASPLLLDAAEDSPLSWAHYDGKSPDRSKFMQLGPLNSLSAGSAFPAVRHLTRSLQFQQLLVTSPESSSNTLKPVKSVPQIPSSCAPRDRCNSAHVAGLKSFASQNADLPHNNSTEANRTPLFAAIVMVVAFCVLRTERIELFASKCHSYVENHNDPKSCDAAASPQPAKRRKCQGKPWIRNGVPCVDPDAEIAASLENVQPSPEVDVAGIKELNTVSLLIGMLLLQATILDYEFSLESKRLMITVNLLQLCRTLELHKPQSSCFFKRVRNSTGDTESQNLSKFKAAVQSAPLPPSWISGISKALQDNPQNPFHHVRNFLLSQQTLSARNIQIIAASHITLCMTALNYATRLKDTIIPPIQNKFVTTAHSQQPQHEILPSVKIDTADESPRASPFQELPPFESARQTACLPGLTRKGFLSYLTEPEQSELSQVILLGTSVDTVTVLTIRVLVIQEKASHSDKSSLRVLPRNSRLILPALQTPITNKHEALLNADSDLFYDLTDTIGFFEKKARMTSLHCEESIHRPHIALMPVENKFNSALAPRNGASPCHVTLEREFVLETSEFCKSDAIWVTAVCPHTGLVLLGAANSPACLFHLKACSITQRLFLEPFRMLKSIWTPQAWIAFSHSGPQKFQLYHTFLDAPVIDKAVLHTTFQDRASTPISAEATKNIEVSAGAARSHSSAFEHQMYETQTSSNGLLDERNIKTKGEKSPSSTPRAVYNQFDIVISEEHVRLKDTTTPFLMRSDRVHGWALRCIQGTTRKTHRLRVYLLVVRKRNASVNLEPMR